MSTAGCPTPEVSLPDATASLPDDPVILQQMIRESSGHKEEIEITSFREGDVVGLHEVVLESSADRIYLCHDAKSRRGFAEGAVRAAEWQSGKKGFHDFKDIWRNM